MGLRLSPSALLVALAVTLAACGKEAPGGGGGGQDASVSSDAAPSGADADPSAADADPAGADSSTAQDAAPFPDAEQPGADATEPFPDAQAPAPDATGFADARPDAGFIIIDTGARDTGFFSADTGIAPRDTGVVVGGPDASGPLDNGFVNGDATGFVDAVVAADAAPQDSGTLFVPDGGIVPGGRDAGNQCASNRDCNAGTELCGFLTVENNAVVLRCSPPNSIGGAGPVGNTCTNDSQCTSRLCIDGLTNECSQGCALDTDCPAGFACVGYTYNPGNVNVSLCSRACSDDTLCTANGNTCQVQSYPISGGYDLDLVCQVPQGPAPLGGPCVGGGDCRSGLCFTYTRVGVGCAACVAGEVCRGADCVTQACSAICNEASDCAAGGRLTVCNPSVSLSLPNGTTRPINACTP